MPLEDRAADSVSFAWFGEAPGLLEIRAQEGLPFELDLLAAVDASNGPLRYTRNWPEALLVWNDRDGRLAPQLGEIAETLAVSVASPENVGLWRAMLTSWWRAQSPVPPLDLCGGEGVWMYSASDREDDNSVIQVGRLVDGCDATVLDTVEGLDGARPYQWDDRSGWLVLSPHHQASWSGVQQGDLIAWSNDTVIVPNMIDAAPGDGVSGVLYVRMGWAPAMRLAGDTLHGLTTGGLVPELSVDDVESHWLPYLNALGDWHYLTVRGEVDSRQLNLQGKLAASDLGE